ncbi:MAG: glycosyltransferase family 2 protein [Patescibacteria group bacterium]|jgi:cellulose synthase/poly-beta-1,6-N-acetylglucosamine synthase-like glycosyltransferase
MFNKLSDYRKYRILEIIPGALTWTTFITAISLSFFQPIWVIYFVIVFDLLWLMRILYLQLYMIISYRRFKKAIKVNWLEECKKNPRWNDMYHFIMLPTYKEPIEVIRSTFQSLVNSNYPKDKFIVTFAIEERDKERARGIAEIMQREFGDMFHKLLVVEHPAGIPGEMPGKGSNIAWAGRKTKEYIDSQSIPYENVIVSSFDVDTCVHSEYFSYLTNMYLNHPNPTKTSFQPVPLFNNNIWDSPALMRVVANGTTFWLMTEQLRPERLFTFSSHSMSFRALVDIDFWQNDIVTEDSRIFLQCFLEYDGDYTVTPMYIPVSMDTVMGSTLWQSLKNQYKQQRRWAYGIEHFPYMLWFFKKNKKIKWHQKFHYVWNMAEGHYSWATAPILIFILGRLPIAVAHYQESSSIAAQTVPYVLEWLMTAALIGLILMAIFSTTLLPKRPEQKHRIKFVEMLLQWVLFPITMIVFGSIPAIDAQTRLMLGKYMGFNVTEKIRK